METFNRLSDALESGGIFHYELLNYWVIVYHSSGAQTKQKKRADRARFFSFSLNVRIPCALWDALHDLFPWIHLVSWSHSSLSEIINKFVSLWHTLFGLELCNQATFTRKPNSAPSLFFAATRQISKMEHSNDCSVVKKRLHVTEQHGLEPIGLSKPGRFVGSTSARVKLIGRAMLRRHETRLTHGLYPEPAIADGISPNQEWARETKPNNLGLIVSCALVKVTTLFQCFVISFNEPKPVIFFQHCHLRCS